MPETPAHDRGHAAPGTPGAEELAAIERREERASDMVARLCLPRASLGAREWLMSIPARPDHDPDLVIAAALADIPALLAEVRRLRADLARAGDDLRALRLEIATRRERAERNWAYPPITDLDRANEEVRRLRAYIAEWASSQWDGDREQRYRDDPAWLKSAWHFTSGMWGKAATEAKHLRADVATLKRQIDVLVGFLVAYAPDCASQLKFYVLERDRLMAHVRELKREIGIQNEANRRHKEEAARAGAVLAAARDWCHTYAVRDLTPEEFALMTAVAAWEDDDATRATPAGQAGGAG